jgi:DnaB helicase-like protein
VTDGPQSRHLAPVPPDPPFDPDYDAPSPDRGRPAVADRGAERALLAVLLRYPETGANLDQEINSEDLYWPVHQHLWDTWHTLAATNGNPPDSTILSRTLVAQKASDAARLVADLITDDDLRTATPANASSYAESIRDDARRRAFVDVFTKGLDLAHNAAGRLDTYLPEALQTLDDAINRFGARPDAASRTGLADLSWVRTGHEPRQPPPTYVRRTDGTALFYAGKVNGIFGDPEHGKTWAAQLAVVQALNEGGTAAMIDVDHNGPNATAGRLFLLGAELEAIADPDRFRYYEPEDGEELLAAVGDITTRGTDVMVLDSLGEIFPMLGVKTNDGDEITTAMRQVCTRPALAGSCVITIDHLPKGVDARSSGFAIGSIAKKRMMRGAYIRADAKVKPAPGQIGRITLRIEKDTMGELRRSSGGGFAGDLVLDSTDDRFLQWHIGRSTTPKNEDGTIRPTNLMERVSGYIGDHDGCTQNDILTDVTGKDRWIKEALQILVNEGHVSRQPGKQRRFHHHLEIPYREAEDDHAQPTD